MIETMSGPGGDPLEQAHDVLAAEEFAMPTLDPSLRHGPVTLPADPAGITAPHDVLAAEEFPMPAPRPGVRAAIAVSGRGSRPARPAAVVGALLGLLVVRRLLRRRGA
jgi:hypothetical protein